MSRPWTRLWTKTLDNTFLMTDHNAFNVWHKLLMSVNDRGEYASTGREMAVFFGLKYTTLYKTLVRIEKEKMLQIIATPRGKQTIVKVINWPKYQPKLTPVGKQISRQYDEQQTPLLKEDVVSSSVSSSVASRGAAGKQPVSRATQNNGGRESPLDIRIKNKERKYDFFDYFLLQNELVDFIEMRQVLKKPLTQKALDLVVAKVRTLYPDDIETQKACINQSVENSWQGVFPVKQEQIIETAKMSERDRKMKERHEALSRNG